MRTDSTGVSRPSASFIPQAVPMTVGRPGWRFRMVDLAVGLMALLALVEHFRARAAYWSAPLYGLILPFLLVALSPAYRARARRWWGVAWARVDVYSSEGGPIPWLATLALVVVPAWLVDLSNDRTLGAIDTRPVVPTAISLLTEGNWELGEYFHPGVRIVQLLDREGKVPLCFQVRPGGIYSTYPAGMVPFAVAVGGVSSLCGAKLDNVEVHLHLEKMTSSLVAALSVGLFFLIALRLAPSRPAWVATAILAVGSGLFSTASMGLWQHGGIIFWSLLILLVEFRRVDSPSSWGSAIQGFACAQLVTCRLTSVAFVVPFGAWVLWRNPRRAFTIVGFAAMAYLPWAWAYWSTYGGLFGPSTGVLTGGLWSLDLAGPLAAVLFSPSRGLLVYQPWILLPLALLIPSVRSRVGAQGWAKGPGDWEWCCMGVIATQVLLISAWSCWWGGWCWGSRLVLEIVPLCALLCVRPIAGLWDSRWGRALVISLGLLGLMAQVPVVYFNATRWNATATFPEDAWSWSKAPFLDWRPGP